MNITVSAEAVETAVEIALSGLDDIVKKISSQEKPFQDISKPAQDLVKKSMVDFKNKDYTEAVLKLQEVIRLEPQYNRGKLQLMNIHKRMGYDYVVAFSGGIVYERAKDKYTKMQAASIVGEVCHAAYKTNRKRLCLDQAFNFFSLAIECDGDNPVPRWNRIAVLKDFGRKSATIKNELTEMCNKISSAPGQYASEVKAILLDWSTLGSGDEFSHWHNILEVEATIPQRSAEKCERKKIIRSAMIIAVLATMIGGMAITVAKITTELPSSVGHPNDTLRQEVNIQELTHRVPNSAPVELDQDNLLQPASIEFDQDKLLKSPSIEFGQDKLLKSASIEFDQDKLLKSPMIHFDQNKLMASIEFDQTKLA